MRLDHFLQDRLRGHSRTRLQQWIKSGRVRVDGISAKPSLILKGTERIDVDPTEPPPLRAAPEDLPVSVLYEDAGVIAIDKPAGMVVHAGAGNHSGTLVNALLHRFSKLSSVGGEMRPGIVHRLDKQTSGVLLVAKTDEAHRDLAAQFSGRAVAKMYLALVHGEVKRAAGKIELPVGRDAVRRIRMTVRTSRGRAAVTEYQVLRRVGKYTLLEVRIHTGRTHQIRVHMAGIGHPVAGDRLYGAPASAPGKPAGDRFFLHAWRISFRSPATGREVTVEAPLPPDLTTWLEALDAL